MDMDILSRTISDTFYWAFAKMFALVSIVLLVLLISVTGCPCHSAWSLGMGGRFLSERPKLAKRAFQKKKVVCPMMGRLAPQLAVGMLKDTLYIVRADSWRGIVGVSGLL